ncbi:iron complex transport system substrate-binding protein [Pedobacter alluvionis]|uniref:ABC transporter n=2 Tax=Pedobacter alluvionis TaxID=475253 RepID=A0A497XRY4_9SPHI|nr:iron complex transport system substrate-binding protein [Pedobacter alluvionis]TFB28772.1 ABC transporter [Pedobacter alluvionis]
MQQMKKIFRTVTFALLAFFAGGALSMAQTTTEKISIAHSLGTTEVSIKPKRIVVLDFGALETLNDLGEGNNIVGIAKPGLPDYLKQYQSEKYADVGNLMVVDNEKIKALKPDLIISSARLEKAYPDLSKIAPTIYPGFDYEFYWESFKKNQRNYGLIFNKEKQVEKILNTLSQKMEHVRAKAIASGKNTLLIMLFHDGRMVALKNHSYFGFIFDVLGIKQAANIPANAPFGQPLTIEDILKYNPDMIFVIDRGAVVENIPVDKSKLETDLIRQTRAYKNGNFIYLDPVAWYVSGGGTTSVNKMIDEIDAAFK